jgi:hypothetical protein
LVYFALIQEFGYCLCSPYNDKKVVGVFVRFRAASRVVKLILEQK